MAVAEPDRVRWLLACLVLSSLPARADSARERYERGTRAFDLGHYDEAGAEYEAAYRLKDDPALLYNLGQAARLAGDGPRALHFYRAYLRRVPKAKNREEVEGKVAELEKLVSQQARTQSMPPDLPIKVPESEPPVVEKTVVEKVEIAAPPSLTVVAAPGRGRAMRAAGIACTVLGVALAGAGVGLGVHARSLSGELSRESAAGRPFDGDRFDLGGRLDGAAIALDVIGGVAAAAGVALLLAGRAR